MKFYIKYTLTVLFFWTMVSAAFWLGGALAFATFNILEWAEEGRGLISFFYIMALFFSMGIATEITK